MNKHPKLVFIAGLGHSGSTLFDLLLGVQDGVTGLGEIDVFINKEKRDWFLERYDKYPCTCRKKPSECPIWGEFKKFIDENPDRSYSKYYGKLLQIAIRNTDSQYFIDSSKNLRTLRRVYSSLGEIGLTKDQFYVLHLVKDVRSFATTSIRNGRSNSILKMFRHWSKTNTRYEDFLTENNIKNLNVGYDELALSALFLMEKVMDFLTDGHPAEVSLDLTHTGSHIISGNNMRHDQADSIRYDYRWFNESKINLLYSLLPILNKLNRKWVYSNVDPFMIKKDRFKPPKNN